MRPAGAFRRETLRQPRPYLKSTDCNRNRDRGQSGEAEVSRPTRKTLLQATIFTLMRTTFCTASICLRMDRIDIIGFTTTKGDVLSSGFNNDRSAFATCLGRNCGNDYGNGCSQEVSREYVFGFPFHSVAGDIVISLCTQGSRSKRAA